MLPVPFAGRLGYDAVFIVTYAAWLVFEMSPVLRGNRAIRRRARDRGSFRFLILMIWAGIALAFAACFGCSKRRSPGCGRKCFF